MLDQDFDLVIFDCDGTLVDSEPITNQVLVEYVSEFGLELDPVETLNLFIGRDMHGIVKTLESRLQRSLPGDFVPEFRHRQELALKRDLQAIEGAENLLSSMSTQKCLASNAPQTKIAINLSVTGLDRFFDDDAVFSAYDISAWKPDPALFLFASSRFDVEPSRCVVIEDSKAGIEAGLAAGMQVVGFTDEGVRSFEGIPCVGKLKELIPILSR